MRVLIACEYSGIVRDAFRLKGHDAWSCDVLPCESNSEYHYQGDVRDILEAEWDLMIAHPPCTYLSYAANAYWNHPGRAELRQEGHDFFMLLYSADISKIAVENPVGWMNKVFRKPNQTIQPYQFGDSAQKRTCLWLKGLPNLVPQNSCPKPEPSGYYKRGKKIGKPYYFTDALSPSPNRAHLRSKTFQGIADAMASQWGCL